jgi:ribosomal protein S18 acetylase RimI-like enzyme
LEQDGVLAFAGGSWLPVGCNGAFRLSDSVAPSTVVSVADAFFAARKRGYSVQTRDNGPDDDLRQVCEAAGMVTFGDPAPEMICRGPLAVPELPSGVELRRIGDPAGVADFSVVNSEAYATYGMPTDVLVDMFDRPEAVLADPDTSMVVAYRDEVPVAAALVYVSDGTASLQWVGTRSEARGLRLGAAVTVWTTNEAFERGAEFCTLQASTMGEPLYRKLGYETLYRYREYVRWRVPEVDGG